MDTSIGEIDIQNYLGCHSKQYMTNLKDLEVPTEDGKAVAERKLQNRRRKK